MTSTGHTLGFFVLSQATRNRSVLLSALPKFRNGLELSVIPINSIIFKFLLIREGVGLSSERYFKFPP